MWLINLRLLGGTHGGDKSTWLHNPCLPTVPIRATSIWPCAPCCFVVPKEDRDQYGNMSPTFTGAQ